MKSILSTLAVAATSLFSTLAAASDAPTTYLGANGMPNVDRHDVSNVLPTTVVSLHYSSNLTLATNSNVNVTHTMRYPSVLLENIAAVSDVVCTDSSVAVTFNDSSVFDTTLSAWTAENSFVLVSFTTFLRFCVDQY